MKLQRMIGGIRRHEDNEHDWSYIEQPKRGYYNSMNHTPAINVWKGTNRVSQLWEDLLANCVSPDPPAQENSFMGVDQETSFVLQPSGMEEVSPASVTEQKRPAVPALLEKAGFESLRMIRQALEILTAPPEQEAAAEPGREQDMQTPPAGQAALEDAALLDLIRADSALGLTFIKVSREPEPQPGSVIDTRRMAYGLKVPRKPLHKRPIYLRVFFCLQSWIHSASRRGRDG